MFDFDEENYIRMIHIIILVIFFGFAFYVVHLKMKNIKLEQNLKQRERYCNKHPYALSPKLPRFQ